MLDIKWLRENLDEAGASLKRRGDGTAVELEGLLDRDEQRRQCLKESETLKNQKKKLSATVGRLKKDGQDAADEMEQVRQINLRIKDLDAEVEPCEREIEAKLLRIPNLPDRSIPDGVDEGQNREIRSCGQPPDFSFEPKSHVDLGESLDILDFKRAAKISGARFAVYKGLGARLLRALINFMIDVHTKENGYEEIYPPFLVNEDSLTGTGQLPKFAEELFQMRDDPLYLIPTAEVPVTNYHRDEILPEEALPVRYVAYTPCFRREAGSYGKDTRGLIRQHQFDKVELVQFVPPGRSWEALELLVANAESILQKLNLPYRVVVLCAGDLGFSAAKTYDLEVWLPSQGTYREISSCSNFTDYQARRSHIRYKKKEDGKTGFVHTLNGSGLAAGRLFVAILENYQQADGSVLVPEALRHYLDGEKWIRAR
jgi:seryl-tRNA synthetase